MRLSRSHGQIPFVTTTVYWPLDIARLAQDAPELALGAVSPHTMIGLLEPRLDSPIHECAQSITATAASSEVAELLGCDPESPVLRVDRLYFDADGRAVELAVSHFLPEQYTYRVTLRRQSDPVSAPRTTD